MKAFELEELLDAPVEKVWQALTNPEQMRMWYFGQIQDFEPVVGYQFEFENDGSPYHKDWKVTDVVPGKILAHTWDYKGYSGSSLVSFELFPEGDKTRFKLTHTGLESFPEDPHFARRRFEDGWKRIIGTELKIFLAKHKK